MRPDYGSSYYHAFAWALAAFTLASLAQFSGSAQGHIQALITVAWLSSGLLSLVLGLWPRGAATLRGLIRRGWVAGLALLGLLGLWGLALWGDALDDLPPLTLYLPFALGWSPLMGASLLRLGAPHPLAKPARLLGQVIASLLIALLMFEGAFRLLPGLLPRDLVERVPYASYSEPERRATRIDYTEDQRNMDLYRNTCLRYDAAQSEAPYQVTFTLDEHGFRGSAAPDVDVVVVGDSFTYAGRISDPFWQGLAPEVYALGDLGGGTYKALRNLREHGLARQPEWVILAYFEGNDLQNNWHEARALSAEANEAATSGGYGHFRPARFLASYVTGIWAYEQVRDAWQPCPFPVTDAHGTPLAFLPEYLSMLTVEEAALVPAFEVTETAITDMRADAEAIGARFLVVYIPQKARAYWPGLVEAGQVATLAEHIPAFGFSAQDGFIADTAISDPVDIAARIAQHVDLQRDWLAALATREGFDFLDLTPAFQDAAARGQVLYAYGDTHWNRAGHALARESIQGFLQNPTRNPVGTVQ